MFKDISPHAIGGNVFDMIAKEWFLITAQKPDGSFNTMTGAWGGLGINWGKPSFHCFVRPQRYTYEFTEACERMTFSFFGDRFRDDLLLLGSKSGRDGDKLVQTALTPINDGDVTYFKQARLVLIGRRRYTATVQPDGFFDEGEYARQYPDGDTHRVYICDIERVLVQEENT